LHKEEKQKLEEMFKWPYFMLVDLTLWYSFFTKYKLFNDLANIPWNY